MLNSNFLNLSEIKNSLTGIARITEYTYTNDDYGIDKLPSPKYLKVSSIIEGEIHQGHFEGFSRSID